MSLNNTNQTKPDTLVFKLLQCIWSLEIRTVMGSKRELGVVGLSKFLNIIYPDS